MKNWILTLSLTLCGTSTLATQTGTVGYVGFSKQENGEWTLKLTSGGSEQIQRHQASSESYNCLTYTDNSLATPIERTVCLMRLTKNGFESTTALTPKPEAPINIYKISDGTDGRFEYNFAAGRLEGDSSKVLVWFRGHSADKLYQIMVDIDPENAAEGLYRGKNLSCYKRPTKLQTRSGPSIRRPYLQWCKFLITKDGQLEAYKIPTAIIDEMNAHKERHAQRAKEVQKESKEK